MSGERRRREDPRD